jgi:hypothetical protein
VLPFFVTVPLVTSNYPTTPVFLVVYNKVCIIALSGIVSFIVILIESEPVLSFSGAKEA